MGGWEGNELQEKLLERKDGPFRSYFTGIDTGSLKKVSDEDQTEQHLLYSTLPNICWVYLFPFLLLDRHQACSKKTLKPHQQPVTPTLIASRDPPRMAAHIPQSLEVAMYGLSESSIVPDRACLLN